jgi:glutamyl-tRNA synthetase
MIQPRVKLLSDVDKEIALFHTDPNSYDSKTLDKLRPKLPKEFLQWCMDQIKNGQIDDLKSAISVWGEKNNCNMGILMQALRIALVGSLSGPDLIDIMNVLKKDVTLVRIDHFRISTNL